MNDKKREFVQGTHYYLEEGRVVFTALFHSQRGNCCGSGCRHCPYDPPHIKNMKNLDERFAHLKRVDKKT